MNYLRGVCFVSLFVLGAACAPSESTPGGEDAAGSLDASYADGDAGADAGGADSSDVGLDTHQDDALDSAGADTMDSAGADASDSADVDDAGDGQSPVWRPVPGTTWHWQLQGDLDTTLAVDMYDIDLFDTSSGTISELKGRGVAVICYFSAGSFEDWRPDAADFEPDDYGKELGDWPGEWWLDVRRANVRQIMERRLDLAVSKGCDGVEPDNVDGYQNDSGFALTREDQLDYLRFLAEQAHQRGLSIGLKNSVGLVEALEPEFDWALNEECVAWNECDQLRPFIDANKAVFHAEYVDSEAEGPAKRAEICDEASIDGFSTSIFTWDLDGWSLDCP